MSVPDYQSLMLPLLMRAAQAERPVRIIEVQPWIASDLGLTDAQLQERLKSGQQTVFHNRLHWAKQYLTRAGLLESTKYGEFQITDAARALLLKKPSTINNKVLAQYPAFQAWLNDRAQSPGPDSEKPTAAATSDVAVTTPEERIELANSELRSSLKADLLDRVRRLSPGEFEELIVLLLVRMGYGQGREELAQALGGAGDGGVDGVVNQDPLGLDRVYIQAKRYKDGNGVGPDAINSFIGALNIKRANKGVFVTASSFSKQAREHADRSSTHVVLIDGARLAELMVQHNVGVVVRDTVQIKAVDEGFFGE